HGVGLAAVGRVDAEQMGSAGARIRAAERPEAEHRELAVRVERHAVDRRHEAARGDGIDRAGRGVDAHDLSLGDHGQQIAGRQNDRGRRRGAEPGRGRCDAHGPDPGQRHAQEPRHRRPSLIRPYAGGAASVNASSALDSSPDLSLDSGPMMKSRRQQSRDEQRQRILEAARSLFGARSFEDVTMADIAELAGVARATVFNHFPGKHALVEAITEEVLSYWAGMLGHALAAQETGTPALVRALFAHMGAGIAHYYRFYRGVFREIAKLQVGLEEGSGAARARAAALERLTGLLARGQGRGE